jgi:hypothetical protein
MKHEVPSVLGEQEKKAEIVFHMLKHVQSQHDVVALGCLEQIIAPDVDLRMPKSRDLNGVGRYVSTNHRRDIQLPTK